MRLPKTLATLTVATLALPELAPTALSAGTTAADRPLDCRFDAACIEAGLCTEVDRPARLSPDGAGGWVLELEGGSLPGVIEVEDGLRIFDGRAAGLRLILGIAADGSARLMAMETDPLAVATYSGHCEED